MPKTNSKTYDKQSLLTLAERLEAFAQRYRSMAASVGEETIELLNQSSLEKSLAFLRIHAGKATMSVEKFVEDRTIQDLASESKPQHSRKNCQSCLQVLYAKKKYGDPIKAAQYESSLIRQGRLMPIYDKSFVKRKVRAS